METAEANIQTTENAGASQPATFEEQRPTVAGLFSLNWKKSTVNISGGRFKHILAHPKDDQILAREDELDFEIPIGKDGSYSLPDATAQEEIDAKYGEELRIEVNGYPEGSAIPKSHSAAAFNGLFQREIYLDPECDIFGEYLEFIEEVGSGDEPDYVMRHTLRAPDEKLLKTIRQKMGSGSKVLPGKRGKQKFVQKSNLRWAMGFYEQLFDRIDGAEIDGATCNTGNRSEFVAWIDPFSKRRVITEMISELVGNLLD